MKKTFSFRLSEEAVRLLDLLAKHLGLTRTGVIEMSLRQEARRRSKGRGSPQLPSREDPDIQEPQQ